jgi:hypothetical protein
MATKQKTSARSSTSKARRPSSTSKPRKSPAARSREAVEDKAKDAGHAVGNAASKAKVPLLAGGAALAGAAGGLALGSRRSSRRPRVKVSSKDLAKAARDVGGFGAQVGRLASELQQTREAAGNGKHRSPVEVVLEGLTSRRLRG